MQFEGVSPSIFDLVIFDSELLVERHIIKVSQEEFCFLYIYTYISVKFVHTLIDFAVIL